jgi:acyloxyacyl hydrolase
LLDLDGDKHSTMRELRGFNWRGKDCDDSNGNVYPGRAVNNYGPNVDHNCNGIVGINVRIFTPLVLLFVFAWC